jgi:putative RecB family exonuclease
MSPSDFNVAAVFREEMDLAVAEEVTRSGFAVSEWFWAGPRNGQQAIEKWYEDGPAYVQNFIDWYELNPDVEIWTTPDGIPAIELPFEIMLGGTQVRGCIDLVLKAGSALIVTDLKSGAKAPDNNRQLAIYACALEIEYGIRPRYGTWFMCRGLGRGDKPKTYFVRPVELDRPQYSAAYLAREFAQAGKGISEGVFPAKPGERCGRCGVAYACTEAAGPQARQLDPNYPGAKHG